MRLHSDLLTQRQTLDALNDAIKAGTVAPSVYFEVHTGHGSRSHAHAFEIQLGCTEKVKGDKRSWKNSGQYGASPVYAATYAEWGWFIANLYKVDPDMVFGPYKSAESFHTQTMYVFADTIPQPDPFPYQIKGHRKPIRLASAHPYYTTIKNPRNAEGVAAL